MSRESCFFIYRVCNQSARNTATCPNFGDHLIMRTLEVTFSIPKPFTLNLFSLCFFQGSELYDMAIRDNLNFLDPKVSNYRQIRKTPLNLLISMVPSYPNSLIRFLLRFRSPFIINILSFINIRIFNFFIKL